MNQGHLGLQVFWDGTAVTGVTIRNTRPQASRLLLGRIAAEVLAVVPHLFSLCRHGQTIAAATALAAAEGRQDVDKRDAALAAESAQEHLWRLLLDWPAMLGDKPALEAFAFWHQRLAAVAATGDWSDTGPAFAEFCERKLLGTDAAEWLGSDGGAPIDRTTVCGRMLEKLANEAPLPPITSFLPDGLDAEAYYQSMAADLDEAFARAPTWRGEVVETGPYARWRHILSAARTRAAIGGRVQARFSELASLVLELTGRSPLRRRFDACSPSPGTGFAVTETARGLLIHYLRLEQRRIAEYRIVAPTEWNFHPSGAFRNGLLGLRAGDAETVERQAAKLALALDPCVPFRLDVAPARHA